MPLSQIMSLFDTAIRSRKLATPPVTVYRVGSFVSCFRFNVRNSSCRLTSSGVIGLCAVNFESR